MKTAITIVMLSQGLAGCSGSQYLSPAAPSIPSTPSPLPPQPTRLAGVLTGERWNLTAAYTSVNKTGTGSCGAAFGTSVGRSFDYVMAIQRVGDVLYLGYDISANANNYDEFTGTLTGDQFSAAGGGIGATLCNEARFEFKADYHVSGRFSADGRALTAVEVDTYEVASGETFTYTAAWNAVRQ